ncbi:MAG: YceH family protein [Nitrosomonas sp.]|nr:YceH family protein [Nitrosomonas sp.]MDP1949906.1 YceH family protein [Nitrosomonas sp.]
MTNSSLPVLSLLETRILGVLAEKQHTVPDSYPLTLNALVVGCNQKSSRDPIMDVSQFEVQDVVDNLKHMSLVIESSGGRVARYEHNIGRVLHIPTQSTALLAMLMLRGPQTTGELRVNCERLYRFADISSVESFLNELAERTAGGLVRELPRHPGLRENRWAHLLSGEPEIAATPLSVNMSEVNDTSSKMDGLKADVARLEIEVGVLRKTVNELCLQLGITVE